MWKAVTTQVAEGQASVGGICLLHLGRCTALGAQSGYNISIVRALCWQHVASTQLGLQLFRAVMAWEACEDMHACYRNSA